MNFTASDSVCLLSGAGKRVFKVQSKQINLELTLPLHWLDKLQDSLAKNQTAKWLVPIKKFAIFILQKFPKLVSNAFVELSELKVLCPSWIACTSNIVERLFSRARYVFTDYRKRTTPVNLESQLFLFSNKSFWNVTSFSKIVN